MRFHEKYFGLSSVAPLLLRRLFLVLTQQNCHSTSGDIRYFCLLDFVVIFALTKILEKRQIRFILRRERCEKEDYVE